MDFTTASFSLILTVFILLMLATILLSNIGNFIANFLKDFLFKRQSTLRNPITKMKETPQTLPISGHTMEKTHVLHWKYPIDRIVSLKDLPVNITTLTWRCKTRFYTWSYVVCATIARKATRLQIRYGAKSTYYNTLLIKSSAANLMLRRNRKQ